MKFDKETIAALVICTIFLFAWGPLANRLWPVPEPVDAPAVEEMPESPHEATATPAEEKAATPASALEEKAKVVPQEAQTHEIPKEEIAGINIVTLENESFIISIDPVKGQISRILLKTFYTSDKLTYSQTGKNIVLLEDVSHGALGVREAESSWILTNIETSSAEESFTLSRQFRTPEGQEFKIIQAWQVKENFTLACDISILNLAEVPLSFASVMVSAGGLPDINRLANDKVPYNENHEIAYFDIEKGKIVYRQAFNRPNFFSNFFGGAQTDESDGFEAVQHSPARWIATTNKYFTCLLVPPPAVEKGLVLRSVAHKDQSTDTPTTYFVAEADAIVSVDNLQQGQSENYSFSFYAGPKNLANLQALDHDAGKLLKLYILGAFFLEPLSSLMLNALLWLSNICGSYGLSIVLLTLIVKTLLWPVTHRANVSMRKMQRINPLVQEVRKKYKDNPQKVNTEMMKLYKEHNVNPLGGCLPVLLQMPIFFALYAALNGAVEPRHTAFLWINDLTMPDTVGAIFGIPINPLMLTMTATMVLQQKLTPSAADPAQQRMMMFMPLVMLVMLYSLPSGLTLYWTVSQIISIGQIVVNKRLEKLENPSGAPAVQPGNRKTPDENSKGKRK
ncbi:MAG: membrane protein insertase YidC [Victivallales bacterium]|nr:membrane protein insertase YidC [Victivallales bacterium]